MAWIEFHVELRDHWKVQRLANSIGTEYAAALGHISCLWLWAVGNAPKGTLSDFTDDEIRSAARCSNEKFSKKVLILCRLLDEKERINDWSKHGLKYLVSTRKRVKEFRLRKRNGNVTVTPTIPNHTIPNHTNIKRLERPSIEQVKVFFESIGFSSEADSFFDHFQSNGWKVGGKAPMRDWMAAGRNWCRRARKDKPSNLTKAQQATALSARKFLHGESESCEGDSFDLKSLPVESV